VEWKGVEKSGVASFAERGAGRMYFPPMRDLMFGSGRKVGLVIPFIFSFATHEDEYQKQHGMLSQWRGYGGADNVAITFETKKLERLLYLEHDRFKYMPCSISDVIYFRKEVDLAEHIPDLLRYLNEDVENMFSRQYAGHENVGKTLENLSAQLFSVAGRVKHEAFREESECRIIAGIPDGPHKDEFEEQAGSHVKRIHYRPGITDSIPYIKLFAGLGEKLPVKRIIVGPSRNQKASEYRVRELVDKFGRVAEITVQCSNIPFVGSV